LLLSKTFLKIFKAPLISALITLLIELLNNPLLILLPKYFSCFFISSNANESHFEV